VASEESTAQRPGPSEGHTTAEGHENPSFPIIGVGASAGGLEAFTELLQQLPGDAGLSFLYVQHLEPHHKSHLAEILSRVTRMPVHEAQDGTAVQVNNVYILPPNMSMALTDGTLRLAPRPEGRAPHMPIDYLFRSLAGVQKSRAIGVILSGGGTDGTLGFQAIKAEGGATFAQDERTAKHDGMPRSAILDGCVDHVLPPPEIARNLLRFVNHSYTREPDGSTTSAPAESIDDILKLLRAGTTVDFMHYKRTTIRRRILRRMALRGIEDINEYHRFLQNDAAERQLLYQDLLIRVTQFFRDPEAFEVLKQKVYPQLVDGRSLNTPIRIWVAGCASGEEVYSLAISLFEYLESRSMHFPIKILATDVNEVALEKARAGIYLDNIEMDVSKERLRRFFMRVDSHYQISKTIRDLCVFSRHNIAADAPFSHLDLISCRNVLIYLDPTLQRRILPLFHYALNMPGFLMIGGSESIGPFAELFASVDAHHRLFSRKQVPVGQVLDFSAYIGQTSEGTPTGRHGANQLVTAVDIQREADRIILGRFGPVGAVIDESGTVLQFRGRTAAYLEPAPGTPSLDFLKMLRDGLLSDVRSAINQAKSENTAVSREGVRLLERDGIRLVRVDVIPFRASPTGLRCFLVLFQDMPSGEALDPRHGATVEEGAEQHPADKQVVQLQQELSSLREYLQTVIEEYESTNEELKSASEEILSANEELQSTNEELQTAKEEAQSANEELATVNEELRHRNAELARVNNDLVNILSGVNIPLVVVGRDLRIRRFTPQAERFFSLIPTDVGRPISDIKPAVNVNDLAQLIATVIDTLQPYDSEIQDKDAHHFALRIRPYITLDGKIDGASITLLDIESIRRSLQQKGQPDS
jgi:two-component system CheB/CheR fusion protein